MKDVWDKRFKRDACLIVDIEALEKRISVSFPKKYIEMMLIQNGGYVMCDEFVYCKRSYERKGMIGVFFSIGGNSYETVEQQFFDPAEFLPKGLVPFAGDSNLVCFDYRNTKEEPPIVFWCGDDSEGEDVHFIANSFEEFVDMLHESKD
jgi:hypothetical protein